MTNVNNKDKFLEDPTTFEDDDKPVIITRMDISAEQLINPYFDIKQTIKEKPNT